MLYEKEGHQEVEGYANNFPQILKLNAGGEALEWITYQDSAFYASKNKILWSVGEYEVLLRGGINALSGERSTLVIDTIIAVDNNLSPTKYRRESPALNNRELFARDRHLCAYCATTYTERQLTRDHVHPVSKGGPNVWENVVTACKSCNQRKDDKTPAQAGMELIYVPYQPSFNETLILKNRNILSDQMQFLLKGVSRFSRLHDSIEDGKLVLK